MKIKETLCYVVFGGSTAYCAETDHSSTTMAPFQYEALLNMSILVEGKERNVSESAPKLINQDYQNNLVNAKRKEIVGSLNALPKMITPIASFQYKGFLKTSIMVEGEERNVSGSNVMGLNGGAGYDNLANNQDCQNMCNSEELQRLTDIDSPQKNLVNVKRKRVVNDQAPCSALIAMSDVEPAKRKRLDNDQAPCGAEIPICDVEPVKRKTLDNDQAPCRAEIPICDVEAAERKRLVDAQAPFRAEVPVSNVEASLDFLSAKKEAILKPSIMVEGKERNVSGSNVMGLNGVFPNLVQTTTRDGSLKIINTDDSRALQRLTQIDVLYMQFDSCEAGESFYHKYASAIGFVVGEDYIRSNEHGEIVQKRWVCNSEEGFQQKKYLQNEFNCFAALCIHLVSHKWSVKEFVATHTHDLSPTCKSHCQIDPPQKSLVNAKRLLNAQAPCRALISMSDVEAAKMERLVNAQAPCRAKIPISDVEAAKRLTLVSALAPFRAEIPISGVEAAKWKILVNAQAPCRAELPMSGVETVKISRLGNFKIINADNSEELQRLTGIDVLSMQFDSCEAGESFYHKYASAIGFVVGEEYTRRNEHGEVVQKRWVCNSEEGSQQKKYLEDGFNCFATFCIHLVSYKWLVRDFVATHTHHELSPTCKPHLQIDPSQNNLVNVKRKKLGVSLRTLLKLITPITTFQYQGFHKTSIMVEGKETNVSGWNVMSLNGGAGCCSFFIRDNNQDYHNMFPYLVQKRRDGSFKIINADNSRELLRLTGTDVLPMQFAEEGFQQRKNLEDGFNCFSAFCINLVSHNWSVREFVAAHTHHELSPTCKSHLQIDSPQKNLVNVKRKRVVNDQAPCSALIAMSDVESAKRKRLVNAQDPCRSEIPISDVEAALDFLSAKKDSDNGLFYETKFVEGHLTSLFWADSISQLDNACFGEVMAVYRTKLCMMHFVVLTGFNHHHQTCVFGCALLQDETVEAYTWLFQTFLHVMQGCMPLSVVTDDHQAIREAIKLVLPRSRHRLCTKHLEKIARSNVNNPFFISDFKACMLEVLSQDDFELKWKRMVEMYKVSENPWIQRMHRERHMWAETYLRGSFSAGLQSTKICESIDKHLRKFSQNNLKLHEFLYEFECAINALWREEGKAECKSAILQVALSNPLKKHAADVFTRESYKKFLSEMRLESHLFVVNKDEGTDHSRYRLCNPENRNLIYEVMFKPCGPSIKCSCLKFETLGFPCCHAIHVLKSEGIEKIPQDLIHPRWTKSAKLSAQFWHRSLPPVSSDIMLEMMCYGNSAYFSSILCYWVTKSDNIHNLLLGGDHELERELQDQLWCI